MKLKLPEIAENKKIALAVSGGTDSMALLWLFKTEYKGSFYVINVEHGIRGEASVSDSRFVEDFCRKHEIEFKGFCVNAPEYAKEKRISLELAARELRHAIFSAEIEKGFCDFVATAHHKNDQAETVLLRICRGTGIYGLQGIAPVKNFLIRPLLNYSKTELSEYLSENDIPHCNDETNEFDNITRNYFRLNVIPKIEKKFPQFCDSVTRLTRAATEAEDFARSLIDEPIKTTSGGYKIKMPFKHPYLFKKEIGLCFEKSGVIQDVEERHFELILNLASDSNGKRLDMPFGITVYKESDGLAFEKKNDKESLVLPLSNIFTDSEFGRFFKLSKVDEKTDGLKCDWDKIPKTAVLRYRKDGDKFTKFGGGTKNLGDFLTDKKIPLRLRDNLLVIANENDILLIVGVEISDKIKIDENTKTVLSVKGENNVR